MAAKFKFEPCTTCCTCLDGVISCDMAVEDIEWTMTVSGATGAVSLANATVTLTYFSYWDSEPCIHSWRYESAGFYYGLWLYRSMTDGTWYYIAGVSAKNLSLGSCEYASAEIDIAFDCETFVADANQNWDDPNEFHWKDVHFDVALA